MMTNKIWHRIFSFENLFTPVSVEKFTYVNSPSYGYLYIFGVRVARWNLA